VSVTPAYERGETIWNPVRFLQHLLVLLVSAGWPLLQVNFSVKEFTIRAVNLPIGATGTVFLIPLIYGGLKSDERRFILRNVQNIDATHINASEFILQDTSHVLKVRINAKIDDRIQEEMKREHCLEATGLYNLKKRRCWGWNCYFEGPYLEKYCWSSFSPELQMALSWLTFVEKKCFVTIGIISPFELCLRGTSRCPEEWPRCRPCSFRYRAWGRRDGDRL